MNDEIMMSILDDVKEAVKSFNYDFQDRSLESDTYKHYVDSMLMEMFDDKSVTEEINKTGFPDAVVLYVIQNEMQCEFSSIQDFSLVEARWLSCPSQVGYIFDIILKDQVKLTTIEIDISKGDTKCE